MIRRNKKKYFEKTYEDYNIKPRLVSKNEAIKPIRPNLVPNQSPI